MENGGADAHQRRRRDNCEEDVRGRKRKQATQRYAHADWQGEGLGTLVRVEADYGLKQRGRELVGEPNQADLREVEVVGGFEDGVDSRQQRLHHVIEAMAQTDRAEYGECRTFRFLNYGGYPVSVRNGTGI